jgi:hypothetical protein
MTQHLRQVLMQTAASGHGEQLHAPADAQQREISREGGPDQQQLSVIAVRLELSGRVG